MVLFSRSRAARCIALQGAGGSIYIVGISGIRLACTFDWHGNIDSIHRSATGEMKNAIFSHHFQIASMYIHITSHSARNIQRLNCDKRFHGAARCPILCTFHHMLHLSGTIEWVQSACTEPRPWVQPTCAEPRCWVQPACAEPRP